MPSPYPWHYTVRWPLYFYRPSLRNRTRIDSRPLEHSFLPGEEDTALKLIFLGDIMSLHRDQLVCLDSAVTKVLSGADLVIGNCEAPVSRRPPRHDPRHGFVFDMSHDYLRGIVERLGVKPGRLLLSLANNHIFDQGEAGYVSTQECFADLGIQPLGLWNGGTSPISRVEVEGLAVGVAAWTQWMNIEPKRVDPGVWRQHHMEGMDAAELKRRHALDVVVAFPHWEWEFQHFPHPSTRRFARQLNARQFKLIVGCHPHVLQPMEWFEEGLCAYSLGNFCGMRGTWPVKLVSLLEVRVGTLGENRGRVVGYRLHPFIQFQEAESVSLLPLEKVPAARRLAWRERLGLVYTPRQERIQEA